MFVNTCIRQHNGMLVLCKIYSCLENVCHPNPCKNSGKCVEAGDSYDCDCPAGYTGPLCQGMLDTSVQC